MLPFVQGGKNRLQCLSLADVLVVVVVVVLGCAPALESHFPQVVKAVPPADVVQGPLLGGCYLGTLPPENQAGLALPRLAVLTPVLWVLVVES